MFPYLCFLALFLKKYIYYLAMNPVMKLGKLFLAILFVSVLLVSGCFRVETTTITANPPTGNTGGEVQQAPSDNGTQPSSPENTAPMPPAFPEE
jgi:hypothetical protein